MKKRYVIARENNVVRVNFRGDPDPPAPRFPGAGALRNNRYLSQPVNALTRSDALSVASPQTAGGQRAVP